MNGSGLGVAANYLAPLGFFVCPMMVTDWCPSTHQSAVVEQGPAIRKKWQQYADEHKWPGADCRSDEARRLSSTWRRTKNGDWAVEIESGNRRRSSPLGKRPPTRAGRFLGDDGVVAAGRKAFRYKHTTTPTAIPANITSPARGDVRSTRTRRNRSQHTTGHTAHSALETQM